MIQHEEIFDHLKSHQHTLFTNDLIFNVLSGIMNIYFQPTYEKQNDLTSDTYDDTPTRFKTLYGTKAIHPYPDANDQ